MSSGKPPQHTAEMEADLEKAEGMIRFLFNDVQLLKDGRHLQAEQMYRRCEREKLNKLCTFNFKYILNTIFTFMLIYIYHLHLLILFDTLIHLFPDDNFCYYYILEANILLFTLLH